MNSTPVKETWMSDKTTKTTMQIGMVGLGRMGANMVRRLISGGHQCVVFNRSPQKVKDLVKENAVGASSLAELVKKLQTPRVVWLMVPAAVVDTFIADLLPLLEPDDILIDGGNSFYVDDIRRAKELASKGICYVDVGTSCGVWGLKRGYCMMIGGDKNVVQHLDPIFSTLAPGLGDIPRTPGRESLGGTSEQGYAHCGPNGAGHFVKMVHNGIEYGMMAAYAEGLSILRDANIGKQPQDPDAETTPLRDPEHYQYDLDLAACRREKSGMLCAPAKHGGSSPLAGRASGGSPSVAEGTFAIGSNRRLVAVAAQSCAYSPIKTCKRRRLYARHTRHHSPAAADKSRKES